MNETGMNETSQTVVEPFQIAVPQATLADLRERLARTRWPDEVAGANWDYGTNLGYMKALADYWQSTFDWRAQEAQLNAFQQFRAEVDGFGLHFIHERGKGPNPAPLLLLHGWPDSFYRFYKLIPILTDPARFGGDPADSFDVIVPSLPGYGFSDRPTEKGMTAGRMADLFAALMSALGYGKFAAHGGDWGSVITEQLAMRHADGLMGIHLTEVPFMRLFSLSREDASETERQMLDGIDAWNMSEGGYASIQSTKPQTLAYGLNDSPTGLAAWIVEKFCAWSDCNGDVERGFSKDELLTNVMIYWVTQTIGSSVRLYAEGGSGDWSEGAADDGMSEASGDWSSSPSARVEVPTGFAIFPKDIALTPREFAERFFNVQHFTEMPRGGHFAALEESELLTQDLRAFFRQFR